MIADGCHLAAGRGPFPIVKSQPNPVYIEYLAQYNICRMKTSKSDLLQGTLELLILKAVALEPVHGYAIAQRIRQISRDALQIQHGSLYPVLYRLEERAYIQAQWRETEQGRMAKFYSVTRKGAKKLETERTEWERTAAAVALVLQTVK